MIWLHLLLLTYKMLVLLSQGVYGWHHLGNLLAILVFIFSDQGTLQ